MQMSLYHLSLFNFKGQKSDRMFDRGRWLECRKSGWLGQVLAGHSLVLTHIILLCNDSQISQHATSVSKNAENSFSKWQIQIFIESCSVW